MVHADELRPGYLEFTQQTEAEWKILFKAPVRGGLTSETRPILPAGCAPVSPFALSRSGQAVVSTAKVRCADSVDGGTIGLSAMSSAQTDVLARIAPLGRPVQTYQLTADAPTATISARADGWQVARTYFLIGIDHILFGFDHLLFVIALVLLLGNFWTIVKAATAFTIAHSITLIGTTIGFIGLPQAPVEAVIALSIVFLAVEIVKQRPGEPRLSERLPWLVAFLFGLLHGFGFAGALREIGLPENDVPMALITFNLGVEAGQILVVAATISLVMLLRRMTPRASRPVTLAATYAIGATASFWLIERILLR